MTAQQFDTLVTNMQEQQKKVLLSKAKEYASDKDRLHNFKKIANFVGITPPQVALVLMLKNLVSLTDKVMDVSPEVHKQMTKEFLDEKIGDPYNYLPLIRALIEENHA